MSSFISRKQLYDQVWSQPMTKLAKLYGLSDVGLAKVCKKHDVPRPPPGYWAKVRVGRNPRKTPLPNPESEADIRLSEVDESKREIGDRADPVGKADVVAGPPIVVAETLRGAHWLVSESNEQLQGLKPDEVGLLPVPQKALLNLRVAKASLRRALLVSDAILKACEARGYQVAAGPTAVLLGQSLTFSISEQLETKREEPNEPEFEGRYVFHHSRYHETRVPSGRLTLKLDDGGAYWASNARHTWRDSDKHRLEDRLDKFMAGLVALAIRKKEYHEEQERRKAAEREAEKCRQEEAERRKERRKLYKSEKARVDSLLAKAKNWRESQDLRAYIEAKVAQHVAENGQVDPEGEFAAWLAWAKTHADRLDPLCPSPPSILDEDLGEEEPAKTNQWYGYSR